MPESDLKRGDRTPSAGFTYKEGKWAPLWALFMIPFLLVLVPLYRAARNDVNWFAAWGTVIIFEIGLTCAEYYSLTRGHWIYNEQRILGPKIWGIPVEEPLLYYLFPPIIVICLMHFIRNKIKEKKKGAS